MRAFIDYYILRTREFSSRGIHRELPKVFIDLFVVLFNILRLNHVFRLFIIFNTTTQAAVFPHIILCPASSQSLVLFSMAPQCPPLVFLDLVDGYIKPSQYWPAMLLFEFFTSNFFFFFFGNFQLAAHVKLDHSAAQSRGSPCNEWRVAAFKLFMRIEHEATTKQKKSTEVWTPVYRGLIITTFTKSGRHHDIIKIKNKIHSSIRPV
jgi:hypothetical protein